MLNSILLEVANVNPQNEERAKRGKGAPYPHPLRIAVAARQICVSFCFKQKEMGGACAPHVRNRKTLGPKPLGEIPSVHRLIRRPRPRRPLYLTQPQSTSLVSSLVTTQYCSAL